MGGSSFSICTESKPRGLLQINRPATRTVHERCGERCSLPRLQASNATETRFEVSGGEGGFSSALCTLLSVCWILEDSGIVD